MRKCWNEIEIVKNICADINVIVLAIILVIG
jgi:hypothetical protein